MAEELSIDQIRRHAGAVVRREQLARAPGVVMDDKVRKARRACRLPGRRSAPHIAPTRVDVPGGAHNPGGVRASTHPDL